jgi:CRISPR-associated protein Cas2
MRLFGVGIEGLWRLDVFFLVAYDIADEKRLRAVAKMMESYGTRVQRSIFECRISRARLAELVLDARSRMNGLEDKVQIYRLCRDCRERFSLHGKLSLSEDPDVWVC